MTWHRLSGSDKYRRGRNCTSTLEPNDVAKLIFPKISIQNHMLWLFLTSPKKIQKKKILEKHLLMHMMPFIHQNGQNFESPSNLLPGNWQSAKEMLWYGANSRIVPSPTRPDWAAAIIMIHFLPNYVLKFAQPHLMIFLKFIRFQPYHVKSMNGIHSTCP